MARGLWQWVKAHALQAGNPGRFTVNSSLNAVPVHERFGFVASGPVVAKHGVSFQPIDRAPGSHRCEEESKVLVENARRTLDRSKLGAMLPQRPMRWAVVEDDGTGTVEVWPGG